MATASLPPLPYAYDALEPAISKQIMELHHKKHHQNYVNGLNSALEKYQTALNQQDFKTQIELQSLIKFNGGGHINHSLFWENLAPASENGGKLNPNGPLAKAINRDFGSLEQLKSVLNAKTAGVQGSGWGWLVLENDKLTVITLKDQDPVTSPMYPIIGIDIWEHAYYLDYQNNKAEYLKNIWSVINFQEAEKRFLAAIESSKL